MMAKLVLILANQNALIWEISFDEINLEMILPKALCIYIYSIIEPLLHFCLQYLRDYQAQALLPIFI